LKSNCKEREEWSINVRGMPYPSTREGGTVGGQRVTNAFGLLGITSFSWEAVYTQKCKRGKRESTNYW